MANAPAESTYWLKTSDPSLPNAVALSSLGPTNGIVKINGTTGAPSLATPDVDYLEASQDLISIRDLSPQIGSLMVGQSNEEWALLNPPSTANQALVWNGTALAYQNIPSTTYSYITLAPVPGLTSSRTLSASNGINIVDSGPLGNITVTSASRLASLQNSVNTGIACIIDANNIATRSVTSTGTIDVTNPAGIDGDIAIDVNPDTTIQKVQLSVNGSVIAERSNINLIPGSGVGITAVDDGINNQVDVTIIANGSGGGGNNANVVTLTNQTSIYPNSFNLSALSTGLLKVTTSTGNLTTAVANTDYLPPSPNLTSLSLALNTSGTLYVGNGSGISALPLGASGYVLTSQSGSASWQPATSGSSAPRMQFIGPGNFAPSRTSLTAQDAPYGDPVVCPRSGYYNWIFTLSLTTQGDGGQGQEFPIALTPADSYFQFGLKRITSPSNLFDFISWNGVNIFQLSNVDDTTIFKYTVPYNNVAYNNPLTQGVSYQMVAYTNATDYSWGVQSTLQLDCVWVGS